MDGDTGDDSLCNVRRLRDRIRELEAKVSQLQKLRTTPSNLSDWIIEKLKTLGVLYKPDERGDVIGEIQGWMHILCFHYEQNLREVKEYDAARRKAKELEAALKAAQDRNMCLKEENETLKAVAAAHGLYQRSAPIAAASGRRIEEPA